VSNVVWFDVSVKNSPVHVFDYNPSYPRRRFCRRIPYLMNVYVMKLIWFKGLLGVILATSLGIGMFSSPRQANAFQGVATPPGVYATVTYSEDINVRGGPNTVHYPIVGRLAPGNVVPALGVSEGHEWVEISYPGAPNGVGWVYAIYVSISGGELHVVEPPPTSTPPVTATIDLTLAAQFQTQATQTRLPTFTPPPPLSVPTFTDQSQSTASRSVFGIFILGLGLIGGIGLIASFVLRK
jgi:uncharacterized protein YraI